MTEAPYAEWPGYCPICRSFVTFRASGEWLRDTLQCTRCPGGSLPRERALMATLRALRPYWRRDRVHESSPAPRGVSRRLSAGCGRRYLASQFWPSVPRGSLHNGVRCEDLERQTFPNASFDVVVTQDVMEHLFHPDLAVREIHRTLVPGGLYIFTVAIWDELQATERRAHIEDGRVVHLIEPEYHGNPIDDAGSLMTFRYGHDLPRLISEWAAFDVSHIRYNDRTQGIVGAFTDVLACVKRRDPPPVPAGRKRRIFHRLVRRLSP